MVWRDLGLNPGLQGHWRTLYPLDQRAGSGPIVVNKYIEYYYLKKFKFSIKALDVTIFIFKNIPFKRLWYQILNRCAYASLCDNDLRKGVKTSLLSFSTNGSIVRQTVSISFGKATNIGEMIFLIHFNCTLRFKIDHDILPAVDEFRNCVCIYIYINSLESLWIYFRSMITLFIW